MSGGRFKFRMQRLLTLRQRSERDAALALAAARATQDGALALARDLGEQRVAAQEASVPLEGTTRRIGDMRASALLAEQLESQVGDAHKTAETAAKTVVEKQLQLGARIKDRRVLDRLRDRSLAAWRLEQDRLDREAMDSIARTNASSHATTSTED